MQLRCRYTLQNYCLRNLLTVNMISADHAVGSFFVGFVYSWVVETIFLTFYKLHSMNKLRLYSKLGAEIASTFVASSKRNFYEACQ